MIKGIDYPGVSVSFYCHDGNGKYLFHKRGAGCRDEHGRWDNGGGGLKFGEKIEDALIREIKEEYCTDILEKEFLGVREAHREHEGKPTHWVVIFYKVLVDPKTIAIGEPDKCEELGWFTLDNLPEPLHSMVPSHTASFVDRL